MRLVITLLVAILILTYGTIFGCELDLYSYIVGTLAVVGSQWVAKEANS
ncbi:hypothetical protein [Bacillus mycoides]|nr:hypothetical protein [Bacillus mycoides]EJV59314.1 hypothetical protein IEU_05579 [Bacillus mycoides]